MTRPFTTVAALAALALPPVAAARGRGPVLAPPGDSAISQYVETVPTDRGGGIARGPGAGVGGALTRSELSTLDSSGASGRLLAAVVEETAPPLTAGRLRTDLLAARSVPHGSGPGSDGNRSGALPSGGASPLGLLLDAATGGGGGTLGILLPLAIAAAVLAVIVQAVRGRRDHES